MSKYFQITEEDLAALEEILPRISNRLDVTQSNDPAFYDSILQAKEIISNVRWSYGPPLDGYIIKKDGTEEQL